jgi:hypothetical protein
VLANRKCPANTSTTAASRIRSLELLGKELGMFIDRKEVGGRNEFDRMSIEELEAFLREPIESLLQNGLQSTSKSSRD